MTSWQKHARLGVALFGVVFAVIVYFAMGERQAAPQAAPVTRLDPKAVMETIGGEVQRLRGAQRDFDLTVGSTITYDDGSSKHVDVTITVPRKQPDGRDFTITSREAQAIGSNEQQFRLSGGVKLIASDGFELTSADALYNGVTGLAEAPGAVAFKKGRMSGAGVGMTYDQNNDVLVITDEATVTVTDEAGRTTLDFAAGKATLDRTQNFLLLEGSAHVVRAEQAFDADTAKAVLTPNEEIVTFIELRGNARVEGGSGAFDSMTARDIDLDYTDDGAALERVLLGGNGAVAMAGENGAPGRQIFGQAITISMAADGAVRQTAAQGEVRLVLPGGQGAPARTIRASTLEANSPAAEGPTDARFTGDVEFREEAGRGTAARVTRSRELQVLLNGDAVANAVFTGGVVFEEQGLRAGAAEARYDPAKGTLALKGADSAGVPCVADDQITIQASSIDVGLTSRRMDAKGSVNTTMRGPGARCRGGGVAARKTGPGKAQTPGLLKDDQPVNVTAETLAYQGEAGRAVYSGRVALVQGKDTSLRADTITLDQESGDLIASGSASSILLMDDTRADGNGHEIRYDNAKRVVTYAGAVPARGAPPVPPAAREARLIGPQGNLRAQRIEVFLAAAGGGVERLEAYTDVFVRLQPPSARTARGARLTYLAEDGRYEMRGAAGVPVTIVDPPPPGADPKTCSEASGNTLIFYKSTDNIVIDGNNTSRTQTKPCSVVPPAR